MVLARRRVKGVRVDGLVVYVGSGNGCFMDMASISNYCIAAVEMTMLF